MNKEKMGKVLDALKMLTGHYWIADAEKALLSEAIQILQDATAQPVQPTTPVAKASARRGSWDHLKILMEHITSEGQTPCVLTICGGSNEKTKMTEQTKEFPSLYSITGDIKDINIALVPHQHSAQPVQPALQSAAQAVLNRWDSPQWKWKKHGTTDYLMHALRKAIAQTVQPVSNDEIEAAVFAERAACAILCEVRYMGDNTREDMEARRCATMIRARTK